jgi:hypothetical protein
MKRFYKKVFKSKKPSLVSIHASGHRPVTSTSTLITDLMQFIPAAGDGSTSTASAQVITGISVSVQRSALLIASSSINLLISSRRLIILESVPLFPLWGLVILLLYVFLPLASI